MRRRLISVLVTSSFLVPTGFALSAPASASPIAGPSPIATGNFYYEGTGGPMDVAVGRDRSVYVTVGEDPATRKLFRHQLTYSVTNKEASGGTATLTIGSHLLKSGDPIEVDISDPDFDGTHTVTGVSGTTVSFASASTVASTAASGVVIPDPISGGVVAITPTGLPAGVSLTGPRTVTASPDRSNIAVGYTNNSGIAIYPWDASGATTPTRILLGPAGTSTDFAVRNLVWDSQGNIYALMDPKNGSNPAQIWVFGPAAGQTDAPSRIIMLNAGTASDGTSWSGFAWGHITSDMALGPNDEIAVVGSTSLGWIIAYVAPGLSGDTKPSGYLSTGVGEAWGVTYDDSGRSIITYISADRGLRAWAPGARSTVADPTPAPVVDVSASGSGPTRGPIDFDATDRSIVLANGDSYGILRRYATGASATSTTLALPFLGTPGSSSPGSSTPPSSAPGPVSNSEPQNDEDEVLDSNNDQPAQSTEAAAPISQPADSAVAEASSASVSLPGLVGARLIARGAKGKTCIGAQCVKGRSWTLQMCLPQEAKITVQRRIAKRWVSQKPGKSTVAPLECPAPTQSASIAVPRKTKAANFRIVLTIQDAPSIVSGLRVR